MNGVLENDVMDALDLLQGQLPEWDYNEDDTNNNSLGCCYGCCDGSDSGLY